MKQLQAAIYTRLAGFAPLTDLLPTYAYSGGSVPAIFDQVPQASDSGSDAPFPYVRMAGPTDFEEDTDTETGFQSTVIIHTWSRARGNEEAQEIQAQIYAALHWYEGLAVTGFGVSGIFQEFSEIMTGPDGITRHGVQRFRVIYEPTT